jgi:hypothetical protein
MAADLFAIIVLQLPVEIVFLIKPPVASQGFPPLI